MPAVTATWPRTLNQPVNHAHAAADRRGASRCAQKYRPAEVGYAEQTSAIARPTNSVIRPTATQPQMIMAGPPVFMPEAVQRQAAGQDRDDRERDGVVGERRHAAGEHLRVAELGEAFLVRENGHGGRVGGRLGDTGSCGGPGDVGRAGGVGNSDTGKIIGLIVRVHHAPCDSPAGGNPCERPSGSTEP